MGKEKFEFTYSAPTKNEREQIEDIRREYIEKNEAEKKLDELKKMDKRVKVLPKVFAYIFGVVGILIFGLGLTMVLEWGIYAWGVAVCALGGVFMAITYGLYKKVKQIMFNKYKPTILAISDELLNEKAER